MGTSRCNSDIFPPNVDPLYNNRRKLQDIVGLVPLETRYFLDEIYLSQGTKVMI